MLTMYCNALLFRLTNAPATFQQNLKNIYTNLCYCIEMTSSYFRKASELRSQKTAVQEFPVPKTKTELRGFIGLANYYRNFIPYFTPIARPCLALT